MGKRRFMAQARIVARLGNELVIVLQRSHQEISLCGFRAGNRCQPVGHADTELVHGAARQLKVILSAGEIVTGLARALLGFRQCRGSARLLPQNDQQRRD
jgi:hypothetical protein